MWYVEYLLLNHELIKAKEDIDSDEFNDLLLVEREIDILTKKKLISKEEQTVLDWMKKHSSVRVIERVYHRDRKYISIVFRRVCDRISLALGGIFTNDGYIEYMRETYNLTNEQVRTLHQYVLSYQRHKIMDKPYREETNAD